MRTSEWVVMIAMGLYGLLLLYASTTMAVIGITVKNQ